MASSIVENLKLQGKGFMQTLTTTGSSTAILAVGMIGSQKFLDFGKIADQLKIDYTTDPKGAAAQIVKHQGAIKFLGGFAAIHFFGKKMASWMKWLVIAVMLQGGLQEINVLSKGKSGQIGDKNLDAEMAAAAEEIRKSMSGMGIVNPTVEYTPSVGLIQNPTQQYTPSVGTNYLENGTGVGFGTVDTIGFQMMGFNMM